MTLHKETPMQNWGYAHYKDGGTPLQEFYYIVSRGMVRPEDYLNSHTTPR